MYHKACSFQTIFQILNVVVKKDQRPLQKYCFLCIKAIRVKAVLCHCHFIQLEAAIYAALISPPPSHEYR